MSVARGTEADHRGRRRTVGSEGAVAGRNPRRVATPYAVPTPFSPFTAHPPTAYRSPPYPIPSLHPLPSFPSGEARPLRGVRERGVEWVEME